MSVALMKKPPSMHNSAYKRSEPTLPYQNCSQSLKTKESSHFVDGDDACESNIHNSTLYYQQD